MTSRSRHRSAPGSGHRVPRYAVTVATGREPLPRVVRCAEALLADPRADLALRFDIGPARDADRLWLWGRFGHDPRVSLNAPDAAPAVVPASPLHVLWPAGATPAPGALGRLESTLGEATAASATLDGFEITITRAPPPGLAESPARADEGAGASPPPPRGVPLARRVARASEIAAALRLRPIRLYRRTARAFAAALRRWRGKRGDPSPVPMPGAPPAPVRESEATPGGVRLSALEALAHGVAGPVTVVFGTYGFRELLARWVQSSHAAGCFDYRIVCMDDALLDHLRRHLPDAPAVSYYSLFPDADRIDIDAIAPNWKRLHVLTPLRVSLFRALAENGVDFIHSDADALWLRDPRPWLERHRDYDMLCSQDGASPPFHARRYGFVLCAGFFLCRANERTARLWAAVQGRHDVRASDQWRLNAVLMDDPHARWRMRAPRPAFRTAGGWGEARRPNWFRLPLGPRAGERAWRWLGNAPQRRCFHLLLRATRLLCILTSEHIIDGRFGGGLTVGVLPMSRIARVLIEGDDPPDPERLQVLHLVENKSMIGDHKRRIPAVPAPVRWLHCLTARRAAPPDG